MPETQKELFHIVQVLPALGWGGAQIFCIQLCNELAKNEHYKVSLVSMYHHNATRHLPLEMLDKKVQFFSVGKHSGFDASVFFKLYRLLKQLKPNVVHTHLHAGYYCFYSYLKLNRSSFKKIHTIHNLAKKDSPWQGRKAYRYFFKKQIIIPVAISAEVFKSTQEVYGNCIQITIPNGSQPVQPSVKIEETKKQIEQLKWNEQTKVLVNVARICAQKNQMLLLKSMRGLQHENVICLIIGDYIPDDKKIYDALLANKPDNVFFIGKVNNVGDYLLNADGFVLTSLFEGLPIALLEALSAGVVPVCTPVGGVTEVVSNNIGFLSEHTTVESYLHALQNYLHTPQYILEEKKQQGKQLFQKVYSMESCAKKYQKLYLDHLN